MKDEQTQSITIDSARVFFGTARRHYVILDAPGHLEFLQNMVTGASRAEAALLVIDAGEGVMENSCRHGFLLAMLGIRQTAVLVNSYGNAVNEKPQEVPVFFRRDVNAFVFGVRQPPTSGMPLADAPAGDRSYWAADPKIELCPCLHKG